MVGDAYVTVYPDKRALKNGADWPVSAILLMVVVIGLTVFGVFARSTPIMYASVLVGGCLLPRVVVPSTALWLLVLIPIGYMGGNPRLLQQFLTPAVLMIGIWMARIIFNQTMKPAPAARIRGWLAVGAFFVLFLLSALGSERLDWTVAWGSVVIVCVALPAMLGQVSADDVWPGVRLSFAGIGVFLGCLAAADAFLQFNPWIRLYTDQFQSFEWSVFRAKTSLGHPLTTATTASIALAVCLFPHGARRQWPYLLGAVGAGGAVILSVSRTSVFAVGLAATVGALSVISDRSLEAGPGRRRFTPVLLALALAGAIAWSPLLSARNQAAEGAHSAAFRVSNFDNAQELLGEHPLLGFGPGTSPDIYWFYYNDILENSALQLLISMGIPASLLFFGGFAAIVAVAFRRGRSGTAASLVAFAVSATGFNLIDVNPAFLVVISPLIFCAVSPTSCVEQQKTYADKSVVPKEESERYGQ